MAGIGLLKRRKWGRLLSVILATFTFPPAVFMAVLLLFTAVALLFQGMLIDTLRPDWIVGLGYYFPGFVLTLVYGLFIDRCVRPIQLR